MEKKISLVKRIFTVIIFVWSLFFIQNAYSFDPSTKIHDFSFSSYFQGELLEDVPLDMGYTAAVKKTKCFQPRHKNHAAIVNPILSKAAINFATAPWNWPQHGEYSFLFRLTPF